MDKFFAYIFALFTGLLCAIAGNNVCSGGECLITFDFFKFVVGFYCVMIYNGIVLMNKAS